MGFDVRFLMADLFFDFGNFSFDGIRIRLIQGNDFFWELPFDDLHFMDVFGKRFPEFADSLV